MTASGFIVATTRVRRTSTRTQFCPTASRTVIGRSATIGKETTVPRTGVYTDKVAPDGIGKVVHIIAPFSASFVDTLLGADLDLGDTIASTATIAAVTNGGFSLNRKPRIARFSVGCGLLSLKSPALFIGGMKCVAIPYCVVIQDA